MCVSIDTPRLLRNALHIKQYVRVLAKNRKKNQQSRCMIQGLQAARIRNNCSGFKQQQESPMPESRHKKSAAGAAPFPQETRTLFQSPGKK